MTDTLYTRRPENGLVLPYVVAAWSGAYVMLIEMLGARLLAPWFGNSIHVWGAVIFTFMLALSFGYLLGGLLTRRPLSIARFAILLGLGALATLPAILFGDALLGRLFDMDLDPRYGSLAGAFLLFLPPTLLLGTISPYAIALLVYSRGSAGSVAGFLTFWSTLGSSIGTLLTAFYLVLWFSIDHILKGALILTLLLVVITLIRYPSRPRKSRQ